MALWIGRNLEPVLNAWLLDCDTTVRKLMAWCLWELLFIKCAMHRGEVFLHTPTMKQICNFVSSLWYFVFPWISRHGGLSEEGCGEVVAFLIYLSRWQQASPYRLGRISFKRSNYLLFRKYTFWWSASREDKWKQCNIQGRIQRFE